MDKTACILAVEDQLSEAVGRRLLEYLGMNSTATIGKRGFGYLKRRAPNLNQTAKGFPVFLLTDLDSPNQCPPGLISDWLRSPRNEALIFRVAVMEIESWVMADRQAFASFIGVSLVRIPMEPDSVNNPKEFVLNLARRHAKPGLRNALVPSPGSTASIGPEYNPKMIEFVSQRWNAQRAAKVSASLQRAISAVRVFKEGG